VRNLTDPKAMRALAHPVRMSLLEALAHAGTLTATQASGLLGESPANCAFHLRTLAKYGFVEEAGGGRGRERPWRRVPAGGIHVSSLQDDPQVAYAASALSQFWLDWSLERARTQLSGMQSWPPEWQEALGTSATLSYLTAAEARQLDEDVRALLRRYHDRVDDPSLRPAGSMPVETLVLGYPLTQPGGRSCPRPPFTRQAEGGPARRPGGE